LETSTPDNVSCPTYQNRDSRKPASLCLMRIFAISSSLKRRCRRQLRSWPWQPRCREPSP
jgi:hypothetical protein